MAGTPVNWAVGAVAKGPGKLWTNLSIPAAGGKLKLATDGSPDATDNPNAVHVGMTEAGSAISIKQTFTDFFADEFVDPILKDIATREMAITGSWLQVLDMTTLKLLTPGTSALTGAGYDGVTFGGNDLISYYSTAMIFPLQSNSALFGVFHIYKGINDPGIAFEISRKKLGASPFAFKAVAITSRAAGDQLGAFWKQSSVGS
jgi:hypothetical protein